MTLNFPNHSSNSFKLGQNNYGHVQIIINSPEKSKLNINKSIWTRPKEFIPVQNNLDVPKSIWTVQNHVGPIEGQDGKIWNNSINLRKNFKKSPTKIYDFPQPKIGLKMKKKSRLCFFFKSCGTSLTIN